MLVEEWAEQVWNARRNGEKRYGDEVKLTVFVAIGLYQQAMSELHGEVSTAAFEFALTRDTPTLMGYPVIKTLPDSRCQFKIVVEKA